jgi:hypothetical protein
MARANITLYVSVIENYGTPAQRAIRVVPLRAGQTILDVIERYTGQNVTLLGPFIHGGDNNPTVIPLAPEAAR